MDPSFTLVSVLTTNCAPTEEQALEIRRVLDTLEARSVSQSEFKTIDHRTPWYHRIPEDLLPEVQASLRGALSALRCFPAEILGSIFIMCRDNSPSIPHYTITDVTHAPTVLTRVCSRWRMVALSTPRLWNTVYLLTCAFLHGREAFVEEILGRSRDVPLFVSLRCPPPFRHFSGYMISSSVANTGGDDRNRRWLDVLWDCGRRLETISLDLFSEDTYPNILPLRTSFPLLSSLKIAIDGNEEPDITAILDSFQSAPLLRSLEIHLLFTNDDAFLQTAFPWSQLTELISSAPLTIVGARVLLIRCTALKIGKFVNVFDYDDGEGGSPPLLDNISTLQNLSHLEISVGGIGAVILLEAISAPQLKSLILSSHSDSPIDVLLAFHARSHFHLTRLSLAHQNIRPTELFSFLRLLPTLETLVIDDCTCISDGLFGILARDPAIVTAAYALTLPHLATLEIHPITSLTGIVVADMAEYLAAHAGDPEGRFPVLNKLCLYRGHPHLVNWPIVTFSDDVEDRLAAVCVTGFLLDRYKH
ncbi:hypothetical protein B0H19DRAFT_1385367 [Mycena capillaripes]|nr:hypothetical protein B0H19DRAFT_1385367 [Mycena capillaripes]